MTTETDTIGLRFEVRLMPMESETASPPYLVMRHQATLPNFEEAAQYVGELRRRLPDHQAAAAEPENTAAAEPEKAAAAAESRLRRLLEEIVEQLDTVAEHIPCCMGVSTGSRFCLGCQIRRVRNVAAAAISRETL